MAEYTRPAIHEIKATRADLLADIARPEKRAAYFTVSAEFYYVFPQGLAALEEVPADCGVVLVGTEGFRPGRPSPVRPVRPGLAEWLAIARRGAEHVDLGDFQLSLEELPVTPSA